MHSFFVVVACVVAAVWGRNTRPFTEMPPARFQKYSDGYTSETEAIRYYAKTWNKTLHRPVFERVHFPYGPISCTNVTVSYGVVAL